MSDPTLLAVERLVGRRFEILRAHLPDLKRRYLIESLAIFGSYLFDEQREDSDLDLLIGFSEPPPFIDRFRLQMEREFPGEDPKAR